MKRIPSQIFIEGREMFEDQPDNRHSRGNVETRRDGGNVDDEV